jgi:hypothetical protein
LLCWCTRNVRVKSGASSDLHLHIFNVSPSHSILPHRPPAKTAVIVYILLLSDPWLQLMTTICHKSVSVTLSPTCTRTHKRKPRCVKNRVRKLGNHAPFQPFKFSIFSMFHLFLRSSSLRHYARMPYFIFTSQCQRVDRKSTMLCQRRSSQG